MRSQILIPRPDSSVNHYRSQFGCCGECEFSKKLGNVRNKYGISYAVGVCVLSGRNWAVRLDQPPCKNYQKKEST